MVYLDTTGDGVVLTTDDGRIWFTDGTATQSIGQLGIRSRVGASPIRTGSSGALAAWQERVHGSTRLVVHDTRFRTEVARLRCSCTTDYLFFRSEDLTEDSVGAAIVGDHVYWTHERPGSRGGTRVMLLDVASNTVRPASEQVYLEDLASQPRGLVVGDALTGGSQRRGSLMIGRPRYERSGATGRARGSRSARAGLMLAVALGFVALLVACTGGGTRGVSDGDQTPSQEAVVPALPTVDSPTPLEAGTYRFSVHVNEGVQAPQATIAVPSGFEVGADWYVVSPDRQEYLGLWTVGLVYTDPCGHGTSEFDYVGPSVQALADALVAQRSTRASAPTPVTMSGYQGLYVEVHSPADLSRCVEVADLWGEPGGRGIFGDGQVDLVWILDVDGERLVINAAYSAHSSASDIDKLTSMVESFRLAGGRR